MERTTLLRAFPRKSARPRLGDKGYGDLDDMLLMRCLASIVLGVIDTDALVDAPAQELIKGMSILKQAAFAAVDFLDRELNIKNLVFLPFPIMLVPLITFFSLNLKPSAEQVRSLRRWFWNCAFAQRYRAGTNTLVMEDLKSMNKLVAGDDAFADLDAEVQPNFFMKTWRINSAAAKATICLLAQYRPRSFLSGLTVDLSQALAAYNAREFHHIYPKGFLASRGILFHEANVIANVCLLTATDNRTISDEDPADYFEIIPSAEKREIFEAALIPANADGSEPYQDFLSGRSAALAEAADRLILEG